MFTLELQVQYMHYLYTCTWVKRDTCENFKFREPLYLFRRSQPDYYGFKKYCDFFLLLPLKYWKVQIIKIFLDVH